MTVDCLAPTLVRGPLGNYVCPEYTVEPVTLGPTWSKDADGAYVIPKRTLGWQIISWCHANLLGPDGGPWRFTREQVRFILHWYAVDEAGQFTWRDGVLVRLKGWGKDPFAAVIALVELVGPCRFKGWATEDMPELGLKVGDPIGRDNPVAWVQVAAVSASQTKNTMLCFSWMISDDFKTKYRMNLGKEIMYAYGGARRIEAVTSSPRTLEGGRPSFVIRNEALALDTPIATPSGWTNMGELLEGDVIFGSAGQRIHVTKAHPVQYGRECFRVHFDDGGSIVASDGHWWKVRVARNENCTLHELTTREMYDAKRSFFLPPLVALDVDDDVDLPIDPYVLGLWLGDGSSQAAVIASSAEDIDETLAEIKRLGYPLAQVADSHGLHIGLAHSRLRGPRTPGLSLKEKLRAADLLQNKHIPPIYLRASREQRLALLQGLMDSDGSIRPNGAARFCNANRRLIDGCRELLLGLGYQCQEATWQVRGPEKWPERSHWQPMGFISFIAYAEIPAFRLARKASRMRTTPKPKNPMRRISRIEKIESVPVRCISVDSADRLFMAGPGGHLTRNTHHWIASNEGHEMDAVIERNATKSADGSARGLSITNAYAPHEDSVAQRQREAWENEESGLNLKTGVLYDSLEAPQTLGLKPPRPDEIKDPKFDELYGEMTKAWLRAIILAVRGDAAWLHVERIIQSILDKKNPPSRSKRFWLNVITTTEDAWLENEAIKASISKIVAGARDFSHDQLRCGWLPMPDEEIVVFGDGSKSDDSTGLVGCRLSDGYVFTIGVWQKPSGERGKGWLAPRDQVDARVVEMMERFNVVAFWFDPSHAKDDDDDSRYWDGLVDEWMLRYGAKLNLWPTKTGLRKHACMFDMASPLNSALFTAAAETFVEEMEALDDIEQFAPRFEIDGHPALLNHLQNARIYPTKWGVSLSKEGRESLKKIDLAVCAVGARMMRRLYRNDAMETEEPRTGAVWGI